jgi:hypothetical protein
MDLAAIGAGVLLPLIVNEATKPRYRGPEHAIALKAEPEEAGVA